MPWSRSSTTSTPPKPGEAGYSQVVYHLRALMRVQQHPYKTLLVHHPAPNPTLSLNLSLNLSLSLSLSLSPSLSLSLSLALALTLEADHLKAEINRDEISGRAAAA